MHIDRLDRKKAVAIAALVGLMALMVPFTGVATANHPPNSCLDVEPETASNPTGTTHAVEATLGMIAGGGFPPGQQVCDADPPVAQTVGDGPLEISFEITGPNDPDDGDTPDTPDRTCVIPEGGTSCPMPAYGGTAAGTDTIRGWIDEDGETPAEGGVTEADRAEGRDETTAPGTGCVLVPPGAPEPDCTDVVTKTWTASNLNCEPETDSNPSGSPHRITCTATDEEGNRVSGTKVDAEETGAGDTDGGNNSPPDHTCTTGPDDPTTAPNEAGTCTFTDNSPQAGTTTYRAWIDDDGPANEDNVDEGDTTETQAGDEAAGSEDDTDTMTKTWTASNLECLPETATNPAGSPHTVTCTATDEEGNPVPGTQVDAEDTGTAGANDDPTGADHSCETGADGKCSFQDTSQTAGTTTYRAWIDHDNDDQVDPGDSAETQTGDEGDDPEAQDDTDVVTKNWTSSTATKLDCDDESGDDHENNPGGAGEESTETYTCTVRDQFDNVVGSAGVLGENESGVNDPPNGGPEGPTYNQPDYSCTTETSGASTGQCTITVTQADGELGTAPICFWVGTPADGETMCPSENIDDPENDDLADKVEKTWVATTPTGATRLNCDPESEPNPAETSHTVTCTATNASGVPMANTEVDAEAEGANDPDGTDSRTSPDFTCVTNASGTCSFTHGPDGDARTGTPGSNSPTATNSSGTTTYTAWIDADNNDSRSEADPAEGQDESTEPGVGCLAPLPSGPEPDCTDVVEKNWGASRLDCEPENASNRSGDQHTVTCTATDADGNPVSGTEVDAEYEGAGDADGGDPSSTNSPDGGCTTEEDDPTTLEDDETGTCQFSHTSNDAGETTYRAWIDDDGTDNNGNEGDTSEGADDVDDDDTDVVQKQWTASRLDCFDSDTDPAARETDTNPTGSNHTVTCRATDESGNPVEGTQVDTEATGANDPDNPDSDSPENPDYTCTTGPDGTCTFTHGPQGTPPRSTNERGTTVYRSWIDHDNDNSTETQDAAEDRDETDEAGDNAEPDDTDVTEKTWVGPGLDCGPETDTNPSGSEHRITCSARDANNQPIANRTIDAEATGANDPDDGDSRTTPDFTCTTNAQGTCELTHGGADGESTSETGRTEYRAWVDEDNNDSTFDGDATEDRCSTGTGDESGTGCTGANTDAGATAEPDNTDVVEKFWGASRLDCTPENDTNPSGSSHTVTCRASDANGDPVQGAQVDAEATGANDPDNNATRTSPDFTCETNEDGECSFTHGPGPGGRGTTDRSGTTVYRAWVDSDRNDATDDSDSTEGRCSGESTEQACSPAQPGSRSEPDSTDVVEKEWAATRVDCDPETDTNPTGSSHTITCTARDNSGQTASGQQIDAEATGANDPDNNTNRQSPDFTCTTGSNGQCSFTHGPGGTGTTSQTGTTAYRAWVDSDRNNATDESDANENRAEGSTGEPDSTDVVEKTWVQSPIECDPEQDSNPVGTSHTVICTLPTSSSGSQVDVEATGANDPDNNADRSTPDFTCTADANGRCTFTHGGTTQRGTTTYRAWIDQDRNNTTSEADATEGRDETTTPGTRPEPDDTEVVEKSWTSQAATVVVTPETDSASVDTCNPFTIIVTDGGGQPVAGAFVDVEQTHSTTTGPPSSRPTVAFCTPTAAGGPNPSPVDTARGDMTESPDNTATAGGETTVATNADGRVTIGITVRGNDGSTGEGTVQLVAFVETTDNDDPDAGEPADTATKTWVGAQARSIDCEPEAADADLNAQHTLTCTVLDRFGRPLAGQSVTFSEDGPGDIVSSTQQQTDEQGQARATVTSATAGTQSVTGTISDDLAGTEPADIDDCDRAANDPAGSPAGACSDVVTVAWTERVLVESGPCKGSPEDSSTALEGGGRIVVGTSGDDLLTGTQEDDIICGLGGDDTLNGLAGDDRLAGAGGLDVLNGDDGSDKLMGNSGDDTLSGGAGKDLLTGRGGVDILKGAGGSDTLSGGGSGDRLSGGGGADILRGFKGGDALRGGAGNDDLFGQEGNDRLFGGAGNDELNGGGGTDSCNEGSGRDTSRNCE